MPAAVKLCLAASGLFLLSGLITGVWKYRHIVRSPERRAPVYVDIAHRASLMYSFAALVMMELVSVSPYSESLQLWATGVPIFFFAAAIASYLWHGFLNDTDNQFREPTSFLSWGMLLLIVGEIGGIAVLVWGFVSTQLLAAPVS